MSDRLRETSEQYKGELQQVTDEIARLKDQLTNAEKRKTDIDAAKKILDEQIAKLPPPEEPAATKRPANPRP
jgi:predicted  nucleic acid-binding Zn-ribbon protein